MKWTITVESCGFGFEARIDNDGQQFTYWAKTAWEAVDGISKWIRRQPTKVGE